MLDSTLVHAIANDTLLRTRLAALARQRLGNTTTVERAQLLNSLSQTVELVAWEVASNVSIFGAIKAALAEYEVSEAIEHGATDGDLTYVLVTQLTCLAD